MVPAPRLVGVLSGRYDFHRSELARIRAAAPLPGLAIRAVEVETAGDFAEIIASWARSAVAALYVQPSFGFTDVYRTRIAELALRARLPAMGAIDFYADAGFLVSYGASPRAWAHRSAYFVDRILRGARPADCPSSSRPRSSW